MQITSAITQEPRSFSLCPFTRVYSHIQEPIVTASVPNSVELLEPIANLGIYNSYHDGEVQLFIKS